MPKEFLSAPTTSRSMRSRPGGGVVNTTAEWDDRRSVSFVLIECRGTCCRDWRGCQTWLQVASCPSVQSEHACCRLTSVFLVFPEPCRHSAMWSCHSQGLFQGVCDHLVRCCLSSSRWYGGLQGVKFVHRP